MMAPAPFARTRCQEGKCGQPIPLVDPAEARRTPQNASIPAAEDRTNRNQADERRHASVAPTIPPPTNPPTLTAGGPMNGVQPRPRDREGSFEPRIVAPRPRRDWSRELVALLPRRQRFSAPVTSCQREMPGKP